MQGRPVADLTQTDESGEETRAAQGRAFVLAILFHAAWDTSLNVPSEPIWGRVLGLLAFVVTLVFTVWLMKTITHKTRHAMNSATSKPAVTAG